MMMPFGSSGGFVIVATTVEFNVEASEI